MFEFIHVEKNFQEDFWSRPKHILKQLSFKVEKGSICGFLGANGAGKTTTIKLLLRFLSLQGGKIQFDQELGQHWNTIKKSIGYFPEKPYFYTTMTGREFCLYLANLSSMKKDEFDFQLAYWAKKINIDYALDNLIKSYSKGMLQRLGFLVAVLHKPSLVVLDEPLSGLDPIGRHEFKEALLDLNAKGVTIFFSSHIVSDVEEICNQLVVLEQGKAAYCGSKKLLMDQKNQGDFTFLVAHDPRILACEFCSDFIEDRFTIRGEVSAANKDKFLKFLTTHELTLLELSPKRITLEQIIYKKRLINELS